MAASPTPIARRQQSMPDFVAAMEKAGLLVRIPEEKRVDELPMLMEQHYDKAIFVERVQGAEFSFLANAYSNHQQYAWALGCTRSEIGGKTAELAKGRIKPKIVAGAPCKEVILKDADVDISRLPLFLHHDRDGHSYTNDNLVVSKDPDTGVTDWGIYRAMFRTINEKNFDMTCTSHRARLNALKYQARGQDMPVAIVLGGPTLDKMAALAGVPPETEDFEVLGSFYGAPAELVKCETNELLAPANAEIVLEGRVIVTEGWVHDEGPYGEFTGMYGGGMKHNPRVAIHVLDVRCPAPGLSNIAYARIKPQGGGDAKQALAIMLTCSKQGLPKIAMVFDADVDIWDDERIQQSMAFRYMPDRDTIIIPQSNTMSTDPKIGDPNKPFYASKI